MRKETNVGLVYLALSFPQGALHAVPALSWRRARTRQVNHHWVRRPGLIQQASEAIWFSCAAWPSAGRDQRGARWGQVASAHKAPLSCARCGGPGSWSTAELGCLYRAMLRLPWERRGALHPYGSLIGNARATLALDGPVWPSLDGWCAALKRHRISYQRSDVRNPSMLPRKWPFSETKSTCARDSRKPCQRYKVAQNRWLRRSAPDRNRAYDQLVKITSVRTLPLLKLYNCRIRHKD